MRTNLARPMPMLARAGFTMIEVLLVVMLTSMLMYGMGEIFKMSSNVVGMSESEVDVRQKARVVFGRLEMDIQSIVLDSDGNYFRIWKTDGNLDGIRRLNDKLRLVTSVKYNPEGLPGRFDVTCVVYKLLGKDDTAKLLVKKGIYARQDARALDEGPMLVRYSLTATTADMVRAFVLKHPDAAKLKPVKVSMNSDPEKIEQSYIDIIGERMPDFGVEYLDTNRFDSNVNDLNLYSLDSYWAHRSIKTGQSNPIPPPCIRISVTLRDSKNTIERGFENVIPVKVSYRQAPQGGNTP